MKENEKQTTEIVSEKTKSLRRKRLSGSLGGRIGSPAERSTNRSSAANS